jgi:hypothetical protein
MEVKFKLLKNEFEEFIKLAYARMTRIGHGNKKMFVVNVFVWIFIGIGFASIFRFYKAHEEFNLIPLNVSLIFFVIGLVGVFVASIYRQKYYIKYSLNESGHFLKDQTVSITEERIKIKTVNTEQLYLWSAIQDIEISKDLICMYIDNNQALLIPKKAFESENYKNEFVSYIEEQISLTKKSS